MFSRISHTVVSTHLAEAGKLQAANLGVKLLSLLGFSPFLDRRGQVPHPAISRVKLLSLLGYSPSHSVCFTEVVGVMVHSYSVYRSQKRVKVLHLRFNQRWVCLHP